MRVHIYLWRRYTFDDFCDSKWSLLSLTTMYLAQNNDGNLLPELEPSWRLMERQSESSILNAHVGVRLRSSPWLSQSRALSLWLFSQWILKLSLCFCCVCVLLCPTGLAIIMNLEPIVVDPLPCSEISRAACFFFFLDDLAEICSDISRAAGFQGAVRFQGSTVFLCSIYCLWMDHQLRLLLSRSYPSTACQCIGQGHNRLLYSSMRTST